MIIREKYLASIRPYYDKRIIKIINGVRRSGKTTLITCQWGKERSYTYNGL